VTTAPTACSRLLAPITATDAGEKNEARFLTVMQPLSRATCAPWFPERPLELDPGQKPLRSPEQLPISKMMQLQTRKTSCGAVTQNFSQPINGGTTCVL
jgi:hypothetical protein